MRTVLKYFILPCIGGILYVFLELLWRGQSHWTMLVLGGLCFVALGLINEVLPWEAFLWKKMLVGASVVTVLELLTGCVVNLWLKWGVWDYSSLPGNILGQICPQFFFIWLLVSLAGIILDDWLRYRWFGERRPHCKII